MPLRNYVVFEQIKDAGGRALWKQIAGEPVTEAVEATDDRQAILVACAERPPEERGGTFVAITPKFWHPLTRTVQVVTKDVWASDLTEAETDPEPAEEEHSHAGAH